tara:strand:+ start:931 stop:1212 length:282 start_codon:yes stop_codon:yes gene_type:complete
MGSRFKINSREDKMILDKLNQQQAVAYALALASTAPCDEEYSRVVGIAEEMTRGLSPKDVTLSKFKARELVERDFLLMPDNELIELLTQEAKW